MKIKIMVALLCLTAAVLIHGQDVDQGKNEVSVWGGFSPASNTFIPGFARTPDARFGIVAFRYARRFHDGDTVGLKYTADLVPAAFLTAPVSSAPNAVRQSSYAYGVSPVGLQANFRPRKKHQPYVEIGGGLLIFNKAIPNGFGTKFNFTAHVGGGVEIRLENKRAVTLGYKLFHISNGNRGVQNPGIDNNVFFVGYTFFSK